MPETKKRPYGQERIAGLNIRLSRKEKQRFIDLAKCLNLTQVQLLMQLVSEKEAQHVISQQKTDERKASGAES